MMNSKDTKHNEIETWKYMRMVGQDKFSSTYNNLYVPVPQKIHRCLNLSSKAKMIFIDLISYMGDKIYAYPTIDDIALECGMSHPTAENYIKELKDKKFIKVIRKGNNSYFLTKNIRKNGYLFLSEILYEYQSRIHAVELITDRVKNDFISQMLKLPSYDKAIELLEKERMEDDVFEDVPITLNETTDEAIKAFRAEVEKCIEEQFPEFISLMDLTKFSKYEVKLNYLKAQ